MTEYIKFWISQQIALFAWGFFVVSTFIIVAVSYFVVDHFYKKWIKYGPYSTLFRDTERKILENVRKGLRNEHTVRHDVIHGNRTLFLPDSTERYKKDMYERVIQKLVRTRKISYRNEHYYIVENSHDC